MRRTLIIPGRNGSGPGHWQSWWLETDPSAQLVRQADWDAPDFGRWLGTLERAVEAAPGAFLVAHSLGCLLAVHLARHNPGLRIGGALLVAPADVEDPGWAGPALAAFAPVPTDPLPFPSVVVASRDDPYMSFERAASLAGRWRAPLVDMGAAGHINVASGFGPWSEGRALLETFAVASV